MVLVDIKHNLWYNDYSKSYREVTMPNFGLIKVTLTKAEAEWLYDVLAEKFDEGVSTGHDEFMCDAIVDKIDASLAE